MASLHYSGAFEYFHKLQRLQALGLSSPLGHHLLAGHPPLGGPLGHSPHLSSPHLASPHLHSPHLHSPHSPLSPLSDGGDSVILAPIQLSSDLLGMQQPQPAPVPPEPSIPASVSYRIVHVPTTPAAPDHHPAPPTSSLSFLHNQPPTLPTTTAMMTSMADGRLLETSGAGSRFMPQVLSYSEPQKVPHMDLGRSVEVFQSEAGVAKPTPGLPALQLQAVDTPNGQCYLIMGGDGAPLGGPPRAPTLGNANKFQQATFIPLSRLDTQSLAQPSAALDPKPQPPNAQEQQYKGKRRACHNEVEKRRRDKINQWIDKLSTLLPESEEPAAEGNGKPTAPVLSKGSVLANAVEFLTQLKDTNRELVGRVDALSREQAALAADNARLRLQLATSIPSVSIPLPIPRSPVTEDDGPPSKCPRPDPPNSISTIVSAASLPASVNSASNHSSTSASEDPDDVDVS